MSTRTEDEIKKMIAMTTEQNAHILKGSSATVRINAVRALMQIDIESKLTALHWVLGEIYVSTLKGTD